MRKRSSRARLLLAVAHLALALPLVGQDSHYWTHQYGGRALLLQGAVVGGIGDASAAYYNPAGLALTGEDEIFLGTQVYDLTNIRIETETGEEASLDSDDLGRAPSFLGGVAPFHPGKHRFAYAIFKRHSFDLRVDGAGLGNTNGIGQGESTTFSRVTFDADLSERWYGATWAYPLSNILGAGISTFLARRQQLLEIEETGQALLPDGKTLVTSDVDYYKYWHFRVLWKAGLQVDLDRISFGLTVTTPGMRVYGSGERIVNETEAGTEAIGSGDRLTVDLQEDVQVTYKSPVSAALGLSMMFERRSVNVTVEVFDNVTPYRVLKVLPARSQTTGATIDNQVNGSSEGVVNAAVGLEEFFSENFRGFLSLSTDYSAAPPEDVTNLSISRWDLYHVTSGAIFSLGNTQFIFGMGYSFGSARSNRIAAPQDNGLPRILSESVPSEIEFQRLKFILGFSFRT